MPCRFETVPVVVTGASGLVGRHTIGVLKHVSPEVRAYARRREQAETLRTLGAKVAVGGIEDVDTLEVVMRGAHTVCHLVGALNLPTSAAYEESNVGSVRGVIAAAQRAGVRRLLYVSCPGATPEASNPFLRSKGMAEKEIVASGLEYAIVRSTHVYGPGSTWLRTMVSLASRWPATVIGTGRQVVAPVFVGDVARALAAADERGSLASGIWELEGPERLSADELTDLLAGGRRPKLHLSPRAAKALRAGPQRHLSMAALEVLAADSVAGSPSADLEFGVQRTPLPAGLRASRAQ